MKKISLLLVLLFLKLTSIAQTNFNRLGIGGGAGATLVFADLKKKTLSFAGYGTFDTYITPYITLGLEVQKGKLTGGDVYFDPQNKHFINKYFAGSINAKVQLGEFLSFAERRNRIVDIISGLYFGVGFGYISNKIYNVRYYENNYYPGDDKSVEPIVPFNLGLNVNLPNKWGYNRFAVNLNVQTTVAIGEGLDGYGNALLEHNDIYSFLSAGIKYTFGPIALDKRR